MMRAVCIGECMVELRAASPETYRRDFAGDVYNTAVYMKRSAPDLVVEFCTVTGSDPLSSEMRGQWRKDDIAENWAFTVPDRNPGLYLIETDAKGERCFYYWRKGSAASLWWRHLRSHGVEAMFAACDLIYFSGISLAILPAEERGEVLAAFRQQSGRHGRIAFDPNLRLRLWETEKDAHSAIEEAMALADIVLPSCQDMDALYGTAPVDIHARRLKDAGVPEFALTSERGGCCVYDGTLHHVPQSELATAVDTSGAGDAFNGGYLAARLNGHGVRNAAQIGLHLASRVVAHPGAIVPKEFTSSGEQADA